MFWIAYRDEVREEYSILKQLTEEQELYLLNHKVRIIPYKLKVAMDRLRDAEKRSWSAIRSMTNMLKPGLLALLKTENKED